MQRLQELIGSFSHAAQSRLQSLSSTASGQRAQFEARLAQMGGKINQVTGYEAIERLRNDVSSCGTFLRRARPLVAGD